MKNYVAAWISLIFPPSRLKNLILHALGWNISSNTRIGFSYIYATKVSLGLGSSIGHANFIRVKCLYLKKNAYIENMNRITGPVKVILKDKAAIGNQNKIVRAKHPVSWGSSMLKLGELSKITSKHTIDCMRSVSLGDFTTLAGYNSQIWTHGFMHAPEGEGRYRVDGSVKIDNNVYIGSATIINPGIKIVSGVIIGSNSSVSKSLLKPGLYVNQSLRYMEFNYDKSYHKYSQIETQIEHVVKHKKYDS